MNTLYIILAIVAAIVVLDLILRLIAPKWWRFWKDRAEEMDRETRERIEREERLIPRDPFAGLGGTTELDRIMRSRTRSWGG